MYLVVQLQFLSNPSGLFEETQKLILKHRRNCKGLRNQNNPVNKEKLEGLVFPNLKT
jgi:hypothetical protein